MDFRAVLVVATVAACEAGPDTRPELVAAQASGAAGEWRVNSGGIPWSTGDAQAGGLATGGSGGILPDISSTVATAGATVNGGSAALGGAESVGSGGSGESGSSGAECAGPTQLDCGPGVGCVSSGFARCGSCSVSCSGYHDAECVYWTGPDSAELNVTQGGIGCAMAGWCSYYPSSCRVLR